MYVHSLVAFLRQFPILSRVSITDLLSQRKAALCVRVAVIFRCYLSYKPDATPYSRGHKPDAFYGASYLDIICAILNYILLASLYYALFSSIGLLVRIIIKESNRVAIQLYKYVST